MKRLIAIALLLTGCSGAGPTPQIVYVTQPPGGEQPTSAPAVDVSTPAPDQPTNNTAKLGEGVPIISTADSADLGTITVLASKKYPKGYDYQTPTSGRIFLAVEVRYAAVAPMSYNPLDWIVRDANGNQFEADAWIPASFIDSGDLGAGRKKTGWIGFEVPKTGHFWIDYINSDGSTIFTVKLY